MANEKQLNQYDLSQEIVKNAEINIVSCGNCGDVLLHRIDNVDIECPNCKYIGEPCDFPDLFYV